MQLSITVTAAPSGLSYSKGDAVYYVGVPITPNIPTITGVATNYSASPALAAGLTLNPTTGVISGTPTSFAWITDYIITASNEAGSTTAIVTITVYVPVMGVRKSLLVDRAKPARHSTVDVRGRTRNESSLPKGFHRRSIQTAITVPVRHD